MIVQILLIVTTMVSYIFVRKLKDNAKVESVNSTSNPWQNKLYNKPMIKKFIDLFIPKNKTKEYRAKVKLLKDSASKMKLEWMYVNKVTLFIVAHYLYLYGHMQYQKIMYTQSLQQIIIF